MRMSKHILLTVAVACHVLPSNMSAVLDRALHGFSGTAEFLLFCQCQLLIYCVIVLSVQQIGHQDNCNNTITAIS